MISIFAGTGHRPDKLGGYDDRTYDRVLQLALNALGEYEPDRVISGMALGWDTALAEAAYLRGIPYLAYVPFMGQESKWPPKSQQLFRALCSHAAEVVVCTPGSYSARAMHVRNERMVDDSTTVLALWNGTPGGTGGCVAYANKVLRPIINLWGKFNA